MTRPTIEKRERDTRHGRYVAHLEGIDAEGEMTFTQQFPASTVIPRRVEMS